VRRSILWFIPLLMLTVVAPLVWLTGNRHATASPDNPTLQSPVSSLLTPWPTWTPIPTPRVAATPESETLGKVGQFPFETCVISWCEEYYNGYWQGGVLGDMVNSRRSSEIDYYWGLERPMSNVNREDWSARMRRRVRIFTPGIYRFYVYHDDGVKVLINNVSIYGDSLWGDIGPNVPKFNFFRFEVLGNQDLDIELLYFDHIGVGMLKFWWEFEPSCQIQPGSADCQRFPNYFSGWRAEYYNSANYPTVWPTGVTPEWTLNLYNNLHVVRDDRASGPDFPGQEGEGIYFDWGLGSPAGGISEDYFSARWTRDIEFAGGFYRFYLRVDDGGRLAIDNQYVIDQWRPVGGGSGPVTYTIDRYMTPGFHRMKVEFQEIVGGATVRFWWEVR
jgi:hypothetical protein